MHTPRLLDALDDVSGALVEVPISHIGCLLEVGRCSWECRLHQLHEGRIIQVEERIIGLQYAPNRTKYHTEALADFLVTQGYRDAFINQKQF